MARCCYVYRKHVWSIMCYHFARRPSLPLDNLMIGPISTNPRIRLTTYHPNNFYCYLLSKVLTSTSASARRVAEIQKNELEFAFSSLSLHLMRTHRRHKYMHKSCFSFTFTPPFCLCLTGEKSAYQLFSSSLLHCSFTLPLPQHRSAAVLLQSFSYIQRTQSNIFNTIPHHE
jgi:hypothetical protein